MSKRQRLMDLLDQHVAEPGKEANDLERMRQFARALEDPFSRYEPTAHFTASVILSEPARQRVCLVHHRKLDKWLQPGGHFEPQDEGDLLTAARREVLEETGCTARPVSEPLLFDVDIHAIPARLDQPEHLHLDLRIVMVAVEGAALQHDAAESFDAKWFSWAEANRIADGEALRRALRKARTILDSTV